ncbi:hypothetical protein T03_8725 [Trichinella britovi]|uniref:Uncharacterized protein n=1 Tax=Trichinella britovi TaxID=45882 RepID=A0A0V1D6L3_TRIBR|nr:hypothetical protein T03_8725 [Trichinella britovi]
MWKEAGTSTSIDVNAKKLKVDYIEAVTSCTHISMSDVFNFHLAILGGLWRQFVRARPNQGRLQQLLSACLCIFNTHIHLKLRNKTIYEHKAALYSYIGACLDGLSGSREQLFPAHGAARLRCH